MCNLLTFYTHHLCLYIRTYLYLAPEVFAREGYGLAADIFSFAIVMWETLRIDETTNKENPLTGVDPNIAVSMVRMYNH